MDHIIQLRPPRIAMGLVLIASAIHLMSLVPRHDALPLAAVIAWITGFAIMIRAWWLFKQAGTAICPTANSTSLVTHDVYSMSRNPMYLGVILMLGAVALAVGSLPFYLAPIAFAVIIDRVFCPYEEQKATAEFGDRYRDYLRSVRRWL